MIDPYSASLYWVVIVGFILAFALAFGIGANDVANSFGTSVGSKALTMLQACIYATIFELAGAVLIGYKVSDTMRKGILDVSVYENEEFLLMLGCLCALGSSAIWLMTATCLHLPISGTHSIVGASIGFSLVAKGTRGLHWWTLLKIIGSWFLSPVLSGLTSVGIYWIISKCVLNKKDSFKAGLTAMPIFYALTIAVNVFSVFHDGPKLLYMDNIPVWIAIISALGVGLLTGILVRVVIVPWQKKRIMKAIQKDHSVNFNIGESSDTSPEGSPKRSNRNSNISERQLTVITENNEMLPIDGKNTKKYIFPFTKSEKNGYTPAKGNEIVESIMTPNSSAAPLIVNKVKAKNDEQTTDAELQPDADQGQETPQVSKLFVFLQILTAIFGSFAHGGNDVSNAIGPLIALWLIFKEGSVQQASETPLFLLIFGGVGISIGLWLMGRKVIQTIGEDLTKITPANGFTIEIGAAFTVLLASKLGLPISTTHCKVGSVVFVGMFSSSKKGVDWHLFRNIIYAWVVTVPVTGLLSAAGMYTLQSALGL